MYRQPEVAQQRVVAEKNKKQIPKKKTLKNQKTNKIKPCKKKTNVYVTICTNCWWCDFREAQVARRAALSVVGIDSDESCDVLAAP